VTTHKAWRNPTRENIQNFISDLRKKSYFKKYQLFLVGGVVNDGIGKTNDIDICVEWQHE
jgi:tRNA nucleotidyltransferase/poly(A) polymerase